jgi:two-component system LytT family response regulator
MMDRLKILLVDDEKDSREVMSRLLQAYSDEIEIIGKASSADEAYHIIIDKKPELVFLDIQMPTGNGFSLLKRFGENIPFEVIFITSFDQYAINAIRFSALDYLLKPVGRDDLKAALHKAKNVIENKTNSNSQIINLIQNLDESRDPKIAVHSGDKVKFLSTKDVVYIEANGRYSKMCIADGTEFVFSRPLKEFEEYFEEHSGFIRISKSILLNMGHIKSYSKGEPCIIETVGQLHFEVSRRKKQDILARLKMRHPNTADPPAPRFKH